MTEFFAAKVRMGRFELSWGDAGLFWATFALGYLNQLWAGSLPPIS